MSERREEIAQLVASLFVEYVSLETPCWEGVGAWREDDMDRLFTLLREEFPAPSQAKGTDK